MEWDSKTSSWDAVRKVQLQDNGFFQPGNNNMFSVDLKLGRFEDMGDVPMDYTLKDSRTLNMASSSTSSSSKRGRPRNVGVQNIVLCSVDGCSSDLSQCREYHRRHRVCERHSKTPVVLIGGKEQRFCQQCSRFHSLGEFDDEKRSCRKRLDGHNRRRRKTQPENFYMTRSAGFQSTHTGKGLLQFCCTANWPVISEPEKALNNGHHQHLNAYSDSIMWSTSCNKGERRLPFVPGINHQTIYQPLRNGDIASTGTRSSSLKVSTDRLTESSNSECALSLLSRYPTQSSGICIQPMALSSSAQVVSSTALHLNYSLAQYTTCFQGLQNESSSASLSSATNYGQSYGGFHSRHDGFCDQNVSSRTFPFSWE